MGSIDVYDKLTQIPLTTQTIRRGSEVDLGTVKAGSDYVTLIVHEIMPPDSPLLKKEHNLTRTGLVVHGTVTQDIGLEELMARLERECESLGLRKLQERESYLNDGVYELAIQNLNY